MFFADIQANVWLTRPPYVFIYVCVLRDVPKEMADVVMNREEMADDLGELIINPCLNRL